MRALRRVHERTVRRSAASTAIVLSGLFALAACERPRPAPSTLPREGETRVTLRGRSFGIVLPPGIALREDDPAITGEPTTHEELADGFAAFQTPRRQTVTEHATSWFLTVQSREPMPVTLDDAVRAAMQVDPSLPQPRLLGAEDLPGGGYLISTLSSDRLSVRAWRAVGEAAWHCGGDDFRDARFVASPSWLEDAARVERARTALEAPCRTARVLP